MAFTSDGFRTSSIHRGVVMHIQNAEFFVRRHFRLLRGDARSPGVTRCLATGEGQ